MKKLLALLLACAALTATARAEELKVYFPADIRGIVREAFRAEHPEATVTALGYTDFPENASALAGTMVNRDFSADVFRVNTSVYQPQELIDKGFALDLSGSEVIRGAVERMHPAIQAQVMREGKIYAFPQAADLQPRPVVVNADAWQALGYTKEDVPQSFEAFLDFLDAWVERQRQDPREEYWVFTDMDITVYTSAYYVRLLTGLLMENYILQKQFAGESLSFDEPELLALLRRAQATGAAIYGIEQVKTEDSDRAPLFTRNEFNLAVIDEWYVPLRLTAEHPPVVSGSLDMVMAYAGSGNPELAVAYIEDIVRHNGELGVVLGRYHDTRLYADAQPVLNGELEAMLRDQANYIEMLERRLTGDQTPYEAYLNWTDAGENAPWLYAHFFQTIWEADEMDVRDSLEQYRRLTEQIAGQTYNVSPEELAAWRRFVAGMYFPGPSAFSPSTDVGWNFLSSMDQFAEGVLSAEQLLREAGRIAWMVEMENQ